MKRNRIFRLLASLTVVVLCMTAFSVTAFAGGGDGDYIGCAHTAAAVPARSIWMFTAPSVRCSEVNPVCCISRASSLIC